MALGLLLLVLVVVGLVFAYYLFTFSRAKHGKAIAQADEDVVEQHCTPSAPVGQFKVIV